MPSHMIQDAGCCAHSAAPSDFELFSALGSIACDLCYGPDSENALHYQDKLVSEALLLLSFFHGLIASSISHHHQSASQSQDSFASPSKKPDCLFGIGIKCGEILHLRHWNALVTDLTRSHVLIQYAPPMTIPAIMTVKIPAPALSAVVMCSS
jgi:hypothetical protein